jgi:hypothetical protein
MAALDFTNQLILIERLKTNRTLFVLRFVDVHLVLHLEHPVVSEAFGVLDWTNSATYNPQDFLQEHQDISGFDFVAVHGKFSEDKNEEKTQYAEKNFYDRT